MVGLQYFCNWIIIMFDWFQIRVLAFQAAQHALSCGVECQRNWAWPGAGKYPQFLWLVLVSIWNPSNGSGNHKSCCTVRAVKCVKHSSTYSSGTWLCEAGCPISSGKGGLCRKSFDRAAGVLFFWCVLGYSMLFYSRTDPICQVTRATVPQSWEAPAWAKPGDTDQLMRSDMLGMGWKKLGVWNEG